MDPRHPEHRRRSLLLTLLSVGCLARPGDTAEDLLATDTSIDRPRILAFSTSPFVARPGEPVTLDVLAVSPDPIDAWRIEGAGWSEARPVRGVPIDRFRVPGLVETLATDVPATLVAPAWTEGFEDCHDPARWREPVGGGDPEPPPECAADLAIRLTVTSGGQEAIAISRIPVQIGPWDGVSSPPLQADPPTLIAVAGPDTIDLTLTQAMPPDIIDANAITVRWTADSGSFLATGLTGATLDEGTLHAENRLRPDGSGPVRVFAVVAATRASAAQSSAIDLAWSEAFVP